VLDGEMMICNELEPTEKMCCEQDDGDDDEENDDQRLALGDDDYLCNIDNYYDMGGWTDGYLLNNHSMGTVLLE
jgi:hypothetical protein